jgi:hypothetical protein
MKIARMLLLGIGILVGILLVVALFVERDYTIQRAIVINQPDTMIYNYVKLLTNQEQYSKWVMADPAMKKDLTGVDGQVGFIYAWDSEDKNVGKGEQEIVTLVDGKQVETIIRFIRPFESMATTTMLTEALAGNQTNVIWSMKGKSTYPMNLMNLFIDGILGKDLEASLVNLKSNLEK